MALFASGDHSYQLQPRRIHRTISTKHKAIKCVASTYLLDLICHCMAKVNSELGQDILDLWRKCHVLLGPQKLALANDQKDPVLVFAGFARFCLNVLNPEESLGAERLFGEMQKQRKRHFQQHWYLGSLRMSFFGHVENKQRKILQRVTTFSVEL